jgi:hypothetical protein
MSRSRWLWVLAGIVVVAVLMVAVVAMARRAGRPTEADGATSNNVLAQVREEDGRSADLPADLKLMWETGTMDWVADSTRRTNKASTERAITAASRVFNTVELVGKSRAEVAALLGDPRISNDSIYRSPYAFWPPPPNAVVYCFTNGAFGWQFHVVFDTNERVRMVERLWIH